MFNRPVFSQAFQSKFGSSKPVTGNHGTIIILERCTHRNKSLETEFLKQSTIMIEINSAQAGLILTVPA